MLFNYLEAFPLPVHVILPRLKDLLIPLGLSTKKRIEIDCMQESVSDDELNEYLHLQIITVSGEKSNPIEILSETGNGVVEYSVSMGDVFSCSAEFSPSISGYDYMVAAWGDSSFYTFNLAEKVWMALVLSPRCVGNDQQRLVYDDLGLPEFGVAEREVSNEYYGSSKRSINWKMSNEYLCQYLWLRSSRGVRVFYYSIQLDDVPKIRTIMNGEPHVVMQPTEGVAWYELDIRKHNGGLYIPSALGFSRSCYARTLPRTNYRKFFMTGSFSTYDQGKGKCSDKV